MAASGHDEVGDHSAVRVVGIGGSADDGSQSDRALRAVLTAAERRGARTQMFPAAALNFPSYRPGAVLPAGAEGYLAAVRAADAVVIASPGYHGTLSGLVKNALDYLEELRGDARPYLDGRAVGLIAVALGHQAAVGTLQTLRQVTHALRGWPTPFGLAVNSSQVHFDPDGQVRVGPEGPGEPGTTAGVDLLARQLVDFATRWRDGRAG